MKDFDAVIVGAGLGGLSSAAKLATSGLRVRVLERHIRPGGYATSFYRDPYEFDVSLHALSGIGTPGLRGLLWTVLADLGVTDEVEFNLAGHFYRSVAPGLDFRMPSGREAALTALVDAFPEERRGLTRLMHRFFQVRDDAAGLQGRRPSVVESLIKHPLLSHAVASPLAVALYHEVKDPRARLAAGQIWSYFGLPPSRLSLLMYSVGFTNYLTFGTAYPRGKSQALSNAFVNVIERAGGEISLGDAARRILVRDGAVTGVLTEHEEHLRAPVVVANVNPVTAALDLIGPDNLPERFLRRLSIARPSVGSFCVYLGLSADRTDLGLEDYEVFFNHTLDLDEQLPSRPGLEPPGSFLLSAYNVIDPEFSPPGTSVVTLVAPAVGSEWARVSPAEYHQLKTRFAEHMINRASELYPALRDHIDVLVTSTPITNTRYTGNIDGAIYGFACTPSENPAFRLERRGPVAGLYFAGAWTQPGGGYEPSINSGHLTALAILEDRGVIGKGQAERESRGAA
jgi:prolycopene isomerase